MVVVWWNYYFLSVYTNKYKRITLKYNACKGNEAAFTNGTAVSGNKFVSHWLGTIVVDSDIDEKNLQFYSIIYMRISTDFTSFSAMVMWKPTLEKHVLKHVILNGTVNLFVGN